MTLRIKKVASFVGLTFFFSWLLVLIFFLSGGKWHTTYALLMATLYMLIPMIMAVIVQKYIYKEEIKEPLGISFKLNRWFLVAWLLPFILAFTTLGISLLLPGVEFSLDMKGMFERYKNLMPPEKIEELKSYMENLPVHPMWISLVQACVAGITVNAIFAFGEELGWRGFLQREFKYMGFWKSSIIIGFIWGIWHAPIILLGHNYPEHPKAGVFMMIILCLLLSPIFSYIRLKARSVLAAAVVHGSFNAIPGIAIMLIKGGNDLTVGIAGLSGIIALVIINFCIFFYDRMLLKEPITKIINFL